MTDHEPFSREVLDALSEGNISRANSLAGTPYRIEGRVVHGNHLGRTLGFPTANLELDQKSPFLARYGVYAVITEVDNLVYPGMANAGTRPTIDGRSLSIEIHLFDFSGDLYDKTIAVTFIGWIREERKFNGLDELVKQIHLDKLEAGRLLSRGDDPDPHT